MAKQRILYITEEITPYLPDSENSRLGRDLPRLSQDNGLEVRIFMPRFGSINERRNQLHEVIRLSGVNIPINDADHPLIVKVASMHPSRIQVYFIDNDDYFQKLADDVNPLGTNRPDNDERAIFFTRGTMETVKKLRWEASIISCMGWIAALSPLYIRNLYNADPSARSARIIYTVMPGEMPETLAPEMRDKLIADGIPETELSDIDFSDSSSLHKLAIRNSDGVVLFQGTPGSDDYADYARSLGIPVMMAPVEEAGPDFIDFYHTICPNEDK